MSFHKVLQNFVYSAQIIGFFLICSLVFSGPIFTDEVHWLLQNAHFGYDNYRMVNLYPSCVSNSSWPIPYLLMPGRFFAFILHPDSLLNLRILGMIKYLLCTGILSTLLYLLFEKRLSFLAAFAAVSSILSLGFLPSILIFNRPETALLIGISLLIILTLLSGRFRSRPTYAAWLLSFFAILSWFFSTHPKAQIFIPAVIILAHFSSKKLFYLPVQRILFSVAICFMIVSCLKLWRTHQSCPDSERVISFLKSHTLLPQSITENFPIFIQEALVDLTSIREHFYSGLQIGDLYLGKGRDSHSTINNTSIILHSANLAIQLSFVIIITILIAALTRASQTISFDNNFSEKSPRLLPFALLFPIFFICLTKRDGWSFWELGFLTYLLCLVVILLISHLSWHRTQPKFIKYLIGFFSVTACLSYIALYNGWGDFYKDSASPEKHRNGINENFYLQNIFDQTERNERILHATKKCGLEITEQSKHLVLDDYTYLTLYKTSHPYYGDYLYMTPPKGSLIEFLKTQKSDGVITLCNRTPQEIRAIAVDYEGICCLNLSSTPLS